MTWCRNMNNEWINKNKEKTTNELPFHLRNTMDKDQQADTDKLKERAVAPVIADFVQTLAEWGFNNVEHTMLWEAMCAVIEAGERGELDDVIHRVEELK
tara:strand:+ start:1202 stop:1498 length:297 start_codon:yes stop_codon:yes gene_type:complete